MTIAHNPTGLDYYTASRAVRDRLPAMPHRAPNPPIRHDGPCYAAYESASPRGYSGAFAVFSWCDCGQFMGRVETSVL